MGVTLSLSVTESNVSQANNTSVVKAVLKAKSTSGSYNDVARSGYITIDGTKYTFSHSFAANTTTTLATKTKTVTHNSDGSKTITVKGWYSTDVSSGDISTSKTVTLTKIDRQFTVTYNANGGTGAPTSQKKMYSEDLQLSQVTPTRSGYIFQGWATSSTGTAVYQPGDYYYNDAAVTLYAVWQAVNYTISFSANGGSGAPSSVTKPHDTTIALPTSEPTRSHYKFKGWSTTSSGSVEYVSGGSYEGNANQTLYAVWEYVYTPPTIKILDAYRTSSGSSTSESPSGTYIYVRLEWSSDSDWSPPTISVKCNNVALTGPTISGHSGIAVYRGSNLSQSTTGNIVATITDRSSMSQKTATAEAVIGKSIVPLRLKSDAVEFGTGAWFGGDIRLGGEGFHDVNSAALMDVLYPIGSVVCMSSNTNPGTRYGGTWELFDKQFRTQAITDAFLRNTTNTTSIDGQDVILSGRTIWVRMSFTNKVALGDTSLEIAYLGTSESAAFAKIGMTSTPYLTRLCGWSDGGNAILQMNLFAGSDSGHYGRVTSVDAQPATCAKDNSILFTAESRVVDINKMLDSFCDKFYFRRTA